LIIERWWKVKGARWKGAGEKMKMSFAGDGRWGRDED